MSLLNFSTVGLVLAAIFLALGGGAFKNAALRTKILSFIIVGGMLGLDVLSLTRCGDDVLAVLVDSVNNGRSCGGSVSPQNVLTVGGGLIAGLGAAWLIGRGALIAVRDQRARRAWRRAAKSFQEAFAATRAAWRRRLLKRRLRLAQSDEAYWRRQAESAEKAIQTNQARKKQAQTLTIQHAARAAHLQDQLRFAPVPASSPGVWSAVAGYFFVTVSVVMVGLILAFVGFSSASSSACGSVFGQRDVSFAGKCWPHDREKISYSDIPHDVRRQIRDVAPLVDFTQLRRLSLLGMRVRDLRPLARLSKMHALVTPDGGIHGDWARDTPANRAAVARAIREWRRD